jgi:hypothetical protein
MKTQDEILKETVEFYWADPSRRAATEQGCRYQTDDGRMCAVGRCMTPEARRLTFGIACEVGLLEGNFDVVNLDEMLEPEYRGHSLYFWRRLQHLHDGKDFWENEELLQRLLRYDFPGFPRETLNLTRNP